MRLVNRSRWRPGRSPLIFNCHCESFCSERLNVALLSFLFPAAKEAEISTFCESTRGNLGPFKCMRSSLTRRRWARRAKVTELNRCSPCVIFCFAHVGL